MWCAAFAAAAGARGSASAQQQLAVTELQVGVSGALAHRDFWGAEVGVAWRPHGQDRFAASAAVGDGEGAVAVRAGATAQFVLRPAARTGLSPYAGLGLAFAGARGVAGAAYLLATLGVEAAPGRRRGWFVEVGLGGGIRGAVGLRWRHLPRGW